MRRVWVLLFSGSCLAVPAASGGSQTPPVDAAAIYKQRCAMCHGAAGDALVPSQNFADGAWKHGTDVKQLVAVIRDGVPGTSMTPFKGSLTDAELEAVARYVRQFDPKLKARSKQ
jgi:cytochrome c oxidase cbb3-type subunit III